MDLACTHSPFWEMEEIAALVHAVGKQASGVEICKDHVPGYREQGPVEAIDFTRPARDMELTRRVIMESGGKGSHLRIRAHVTG
jgi:hypothetical protein